MIKIRDMEFEYFDRDDEGNLTEMINAIRGINFDAKKGEFIAIVGRNGSGKSTFAKILNRLLVPIEGTVIIDGIDATDEDNILAVRKKVGMVFQNPDDQLIGSIVAEDVAFGAENIGVAHNKLWERVFDSIKRVGLSIRRADGKTDEMEIAKKRINQLSGGEKQKVAIAGVLAMKPLCVVLDESTSMLDMESRWDILARMKELNKKDNITVILITHIMEEALLADRIYVMDKGKMVMQGRKEQIFANEEKLENYGLECPMAVKAARYLYDQKVIRTPELYSVHALAERIKVEHPELFWKDVAMPEVELNHIKTNPVNAIIFDKVSFSYGEKPAIKDVSLTINKGEYVAIMGKTGAGKSTLLQMISGFIKPDSGNVYVDGVDVNDRTTDKQALRCKIGYVFQYPEQQLFARNVYEDVVFGPRNIGVSEIEAEKRAYEAIELVGLPQDVYDIPVNKLSGGQKRRVALAGVLAMKPEYLILDEPTAGLDPCGKREMLQIIDILHRDAGITIITISHDVEGVAEYADRLIMLDKGVNIGEGYPPLVFYRLSDKSEGIPFIMRLLVTLRKNGLPVSCIPVCDTDNGRRWSNEAGLDEIVRAIRRNI